MASTLTTADGPEVVHLDDWNQAIALGGQLDRGFGVEVQTKLVLDIPGHLEVMVQLEPGLASAGDR